MYEKLFQSPDRPFRATPDPKFYFAHESVETARQTVVRAIVRAEGPVMVLGGAGLGKSMLSLLLAGDLAARFDTVKLHAARLCSRRALLQNILFDLQLPYRDLSEGELRLSILDRLEPSPKNAPDGVLIIVDEAHTLPAKLLDELRLITNFTRNNQPRARLVLIGNLRLEDIFAEPQMESFNQRLAARCYLTPMNRQQTRDFVRHQLSAAGVVPHEFITDSALDTVYAASEGVPRLSNQIMDHAMVLSITRNQCPISSALIEEAWADLQQLPAPWHSGADKHEANAAPAAIEFGTLDEDDLQSATTPTDEISVFEFESAIKPKDERPELANRTEESDETPSVVEGEVKEAYCDEQREAATSDSSPFDSEEDQPATSGYFSNDFDTCQPQSRFETDELEEDVDTGAEPDDATDNNFFAAFAPPDEDWTAPQAADQQPESRQVELLKPQVEFAANLEPASDEAAPATEKLGELSTDSFFTNRPTDEKMLALEDEQAQYDSMGVWENDPPLGESEDVIVAPQIGAKSQPVAADQPNGAQDEPNLPPAAEPSRAFFKASHQLFGDDFEDEILIASDSNQYVPTETPADAVDSGYTMAKSRDTAAQPPQQGSEVDTADVVGRIEDDVPALGILRATTYREPRVLDDIVHELLSTDVIVVENENGRSGAGDEDQGWSLDISSVDAENELAVHSEIEDLVSQLNFSAFSVEPYSVEQISVEPGDNRKQPPKDFVRTGENDEIYTLHRKQELAEERFFTDLTAAYDDDRSMLIIEEDLPSQPAENDSLPSENPPLRIAPYSQLFAKLRK